MIDKFIYLSVLWIVFYIFLFFIAPLMNRKKEKDKMSEDLKDFIERIEYHTNGKVSPHELK